MLFRSEGPSDDPAILTRRASLQRALLATLLLAQGVPMLSSGDEWQHSQQGNNNAYCQDGPLTWLDWNGSGSSLRPFIARLTALRAHYQALRRTRWFDGNLTATGERDVTWLACDGNPLSGSRWEEPALRCFGMQLGRETAKIGRAHV